MSISSSNQGSYVPTFLIRQKPLLRENSLENSIVATQGGLVRIINLSDLVKGCAEDTKPVHVVHSCHPLWLRISGFLSLFIVNKRGPCMISAQLLARETWGRLIPNCCLQTCVLLPLLPLLCDSLFQHRPAPLLCLEKRSLFWLVTLRADTDGNLSVWKAHHFPLLRRAELLHH